MGLAALLAYANSFSVPLLLDDWSTIRDNPHLHQTWPLWPALSPPAQTGVVGRPVANLSFVLNYAGTGASLIGFHAVNLLIHVLAALTLFGVVRRSLAVASFAGPVNRHADAFAGAVATLWLLHPLQTASVTYISQRTESLMGLFYLVTLYCFLRASAVPGRLWRVLAVIACALGMATKEGMVTAPVAVLLLDRWFVAGSFAAAWRQRRGFYLALASTWLLLAALMRGLHERGVGLDLGPAWWRYLLIECEAVTRYLGLGVWPARLVFDYGIEFGAPGGGTVFAAAVVCAVILVAVVGTVRKTVPGFVAVWFLLTLAPTSSIVQIPLQPIAENRPYLALAAIVLAFATLTFRLGPRLAFALLATTAAILGGVTFARNADYRTEATIWADTVAKRPGSSRAHNNLGQALQQLGRYPEAGAQFEAALAIEPNYALAHANLASTCGAQGDHASAIAHARRALALDPTVLVGAYNLAVGLMHSGQLADAAEAFRAVLRLRPAHADAHHWLAKTLLLLDRPADALEHAAQAVQLNPGFTDARLNYGVACSRLSRHAEALQIFATVVRAEPAHAEAQFMLGTTLLMLGRPADAIAPLAAAVRLQPAHVAAHANLGLALWRAGRPADAAAEFEQALRLDPAQSNARQNLEQLRAGATPP